MLTRIDKQRLYNTSRWRKARAKYLFNNPLCKYCQEERVVRSADLVDHIDPNMSSVQEFFDRENWQPMCQHHHRGLKAREERLAEREGCRVRRIGCDENGMPFD